MLYITVRFLVLVFAFVIDKTIIKKKSKIVRFVLFIIVLTVISLPFENLLLRFNTPEELFYYSKNGQIVDVVYGENSCMVYYKKNQQTYSRVIFGKNDNSYIMLLQADISTVYHKFDSMGSFNIYHVKGTDDYYISAISFVGVDEISVVGGDDVLTDFRQIEGTNVIYGYINSFDDDCYLSIKGKTDNTDDGTVCSDEN